MPVSVVLLALVAIIYVVFSPIGLAYDGGYVSSAFWPIIAGILAITALLSYLAIKKWNKAYAGYLMTENPIKANKGKALDRPKLKPTTTEY